MKTKKLDEIKVNKYITFILQIEPWYKQKYKIFSAGFFSDAKRDDALREFFHKLEKKFKTEEHHYYKNISYIIKIPGCKNLRYEIWRGGDIIRTESSSEKEIMKIWNKLKKIVKGV